MNKSWQPPVECVCVPTRVRDATTDARLFMPYRTKELTDGGVRRGEVKGSRVREKPTTSQAVSQPLLPSRVSRRKAGNPTRVGPQRAPHTHAHILTPRLSGPDGRDSIVNNLAPPKIILIFRKRTLNLHLECVFVSQEKKVTDYDGFFSSKNK
ncbi:hypothetical protein E2C01_035263 [Portunus trituberculatus]|uniref:Uncharacterized protein n=1 Tax=Portunus trituberculatus TaxID=210409 RepID=A0A5B7F9B0_PORTR|nr:hypothetical protein [Portunus trituberculatus]